MIDIFGSGFQRLESALVAREEAQGVHSSNVANADTPNYRADARTFADFLNERQSGHTAGPVATTHASHFKDSNNGRLANSSLFHSQSSRRMDGNTVDMQKEMARMAENQLMHELSMRLIKGKLSGLTNAIKEGNR
ncbi:flagellar basal-body rod protein FlgB [Mariprofundus micogutta]|uniref:Flagellar basal body rod protein FlgB n=1 Tax=Mariprofundus micogutta TaxID=1921010 RepID=A0A1L8CM75_9PROT|nr:flagellar basal body rod protein FlgB [Mariprofundus micogutta]GAV20012.1 flagellar basal-body rod protein FlgB [Mariprofundus micogutta]